MSFPTVRSTAQWDSAATPVTALKATIPAGVVVGDLLCVLVARVGANGVGTPASGWTQAGTAAAATVMDGAWFYKVADGSEASTVPTVTTLGTSDRCGSQTYVLTAGTWGSLPAAGTWSTASSSVSPDPPSLTTGFGAVDTLFIEVALINSGARTLTASTSYASTLDGPSSGVGNLSYSTAQRTATTATENPAAVTWSGAAASSTAMVFAIQGPLVVVSAGETSAGADASANQTHATAETSAGADASVNQTHVTAETGSAADSLANRATVTTETSSGADTSNRTAATTETGAGADSSRRINNVVDSGAAVEAIVNRQIVLTEAPVATERLGNRSLRLTDTGTDFEDGTRNVAPYTAGNMLTMLVSGRQWGVTMPFLLGGLAVDVEMPFTIERAAVGVDATLPIVVRGPFGVSYSLPVDIQGPVGAERGLPFHLLDNATGQYPEGGVASPVMGFWEPDGAVIE